MFGLPELIVIFYLVAIAFWIAGIVVAIRIKEKKALYILLAVLSLPVLMFLNGAVSIFKSSVIAFVISTVVICALQISIFFYMKKIKNRTFQTEGDKK
jgi:Ca2+/Na+ antiporter